MPRNCNFTQAGGDGGQGGFIRYRVRQQDCAGCDLWQRCTPDMLAGKVTRAFHEGARDRPRYATTVDHAISRCRRKKGEVLFVLLKSMPKLDHVRLQGLDGAKDEFLLVAIAQNLRKMAELIAIPMAPA